MGVSFTISKKGKRYRPQPVEEVNTNEQGQDFYSDIGEPSPQNHNQNKNKNQGSSTIHASSAKAKSHALIKSTLRQLEELGPSFSLNLFDDGFTIGDTKAESNIFPDAESLIPYCIETDLILTDVECGRLPTGILQDMPLKYVNGTVLCEVRDYRLIVQFPVIYTIPLKMGLDNIIEDMSSMSENFSYGDMLKFESTVLRFLHPHLNLDPTPTLEFGSDETVPKIDLGIDKDLRKRKRRSVLTNVNSVLNRFLNIDTVTRRHVVPQRTPAESTSLVTPGYSTNLISTHLSEMETDTL